MLVCYGRYKQYQQYQWLRALGRCSKCPGTHIYISLTVRYFHNILRNFFIGYLDRIFIDQNQEKKEINFSFPKVDFHIKVECRTSRITVGGDLREYNLAKWGLITLSLLPTIKATVIRILMSLKTEIEPCMVYPMYSFQADVFFPTEISKKN